MSTTHINAPETAKSGRDKIDWVRSYMPILNAIEKEFRKTKPFDGMKIAMSIHLEAKTAYLAEVLMAGGAKVQVTGCNPLSTQDDVAAALAEEGFVVNAHHGASDEQYREDLVRTLDFHPDLLIDDGGDLISLLHGACREYGDNLIGGCEETTTGIHRLLARERAGLLDYPMMDVNDADCKHLFDNRYGTGQSTWEGIMRATNLVIAGKTVVIAGYGWCGKGGAMRAKGLGANVIITEVDPIKAIEAVFDGFRVMPMDEAAKVGDIFLTLTGDKDILRKWHYESMKDGAVMANSGHFDLEINIPELEEVSESRTQVKPGIEEFKFANGKKLYLLGEGRLVNLACGDGHPAEIMDLSWGVQFFSALHIVENHDKLENKVYVLPEEVNAKIARIKLAAMGIEIDELTPEQYAYLHQC